MGHTLKISLTKKPRDDGVVSCRNITVREKLLRRLFGSKQKLAIIVPGDSVETLYIDKRKGGDTA